MTAPSLLDELEGVVKFLLGERPLDGRWFGDDPPVTASGMKRHYWWRTDLRKAHADMAKRLEAAERDAARWRVARNNTGDGLRLVRWNHDACEELQVMFPSPVLCDSDADAAIAATQEGEG